MAGVEVSPKSHTFHFHSPDRVEKTNLFWASASRGTSHYPLTSSSVQKYQLPDSASRLSSILSKVGILVGDGIPAPVVY